MALTQYPVFVKGQTLTDDDLNELRDHLELADRTLGRLIGFGINCGLGGSIANKQLTIAPGLAIDQLGEAIVLDVAPGPFGLPATAPATTPPDFLDPVPGGFTPVLTLTTTDVPAVKCNEAGCEGHAQQREQTATITLYPGRLSDKVVDFGDEPLLKLDPVLVRTSGSIDGAFVALRKAILDRMGSRLSADAAAKLATIAIDGDLPAIQGFKAGFLNQVFFAALDLLRCERLTAAGCVSGDGSVGVALGWAHDVQGDWAWDCEFRHDWQVPTGISLALIGGRCADPCDLYRDQLNAMILAFAVPVVPPKDAPPKDGGGDFSICLDRGRGPYYSYISKYDCPWVYVPPQKIPPDWREKWVKPKYPPGPIYEDRPIYDIYEIEKPDITEAGIIGLEDAVGRKAENVVENLGQVLKDKGNTSEIQVVTQNQVEKVDGYRPGLIISAADTVVLTQDALGKVVGVGSIPATTAIRSVAVEMPKATAAAGRAEVTAKSALDATGALGTSLAAVNQQVTAFGTFQASILSWQSATDVRLGGLSNEIQTKALAAVNDLQVRVGGQVEERVGVAVETFRAGLLDQVRAEIATAGGAIRADAGHDLQIATDALRKEAKEDQAGLVAQVGGLNQQVAGLSGQVQVIGRVATPGDVVAPRRAFDADVVGVLDQMRTSIQAAATPAQADKVKAALAESDDAFSRMQVSAAAGTVDLAADPVALHTVLTSMTTAVEAAGAPAADVTKIRTGLSAINQRIG